MKSNKYRKSYLIAELCANHNGDIEIVKTMIDKAVEANWDAVKFQKRNLNLSIPEVEKYKIKKTPWGEMTYYDYRDRLEFSLEEYKIINNYCKHKGIEWSVSIWDIQSALDMIEFDLPWIKIPSAKNIDFELLEVCAKNYPEIIYSTGMSKEEEICEGYNHLKKFIEPHKITLLHCIGAYPTSHKDINLNYMNRMKQLFPQSYIGYSGHESDIFPSLISSLKYEATVIERHITLNKLLWGSDQSSSIEPHEMKELSTKLMEAEGILGKPEKILIEKEMQKRMQLRGY